jgi:hypothetical protein
VTEPTDKSQKVELLTPGKTAPKEARKRGRPRGPATIEITIDDTVVKVPTDVGNVPKRPPMSPADIRAAVDRIGELMLFAGGEVKARREMAKLWGWTSLRTNKVIRTILASWHKDDEKNRKYHKSQAIRRLQSHIDAAKKRGSFAAVMAGEMQLAKIQGTEEPLQVKVDSTLGPAVAGVLAGLDMLMMEALVREHDELVETARRAPALPQNIIPDAEFTEDDK